MTLEARITRMHLSFKFVRKFQLRLRNHMLHEYAWQLLPANKKILLFYNFALIQRCFFSKRYRFLHLIFAVFFAASFRFYDL
jgi:hypothetical protein